MCTGVVRDDADGVIPYFDIFSLLVSPRQNPFPRLVLDDTCG